jgi:tight adherence protein C
MSVSTFLTIWLITSGGSVLLIVWLAGRVSLPGTQFFLLGMMVIAYGSMAPYVMLRRRAKKRLKQIDRALPDAIDLLLTCVEAGMGVDAAFLLVSQRTKGPLGIHLNEYLKQVGMGRSRQEALEDIALHSGAEGLNHLAAIVAQSTTVGTSMGDVLRLQAAELRAARRLKAQEAAARVPILMTIPLALCFLPAMVAVIVVPSILRMLEGIQELGLG